MVIRDYVDPFQITNYDAYIAKKDFVGLSISPKDIVSYDDIKHVHAYLVERLGPCRIKYL